MSEPTQQPGLFDEGAEPATDVAVGSPEDSNQVAAPAETSTAPTPELAQPLTAWFLPTNRHNLTKMLAVRALLTYEAFADKYYDDLLRLCPGRIPLVEGGVPQSLLEFVAPDEHDIPALLEVDVPKGSAPAAGLPAWAPAGPLPISWLTAIHFRSDSDRAEYLQNEYEDVRPVPELCQVSPERFVTSGDGGNITAYLESLEPPSAELDVMGLDRRGGAALLAIVVADIAAATTVADALAGRYEDAPLPLAGLAAWLAGAEASPDSTEALVAYRVFASLSGVDRRRKWRPTMFLKELTGELTAGIPEGAGATLRASLERTAAILRSELVFDGFSTDEWPVLKALQLVLRFPEYDRMNIAEAELPGLDRASRVLAAAMLGCLTSRSRLPVLARPPLLDDAIASWECARLRPHDELLVSAPAFSLEVEPKEAWLRADGSRLLVIAPQDAPVGVPETEIEEPVPDAGQEAAPDFSVVLTDLLATEQGRKAALLAARDLGWLEVVVTTIRASQAAADLRVRPAGDRAEMVLRIRGEVDVNVDVDASAFLERSLQASDLPALVTRLQASDGGPRKGRPKRAKAPVMPVGGGSAS